MQLAKNRTDTVLKIVIGALTVVFCVVVARSMEQRVTGLGDTAPNFEVTTDQGKAITRSDFGGKLLVVNFWASWCAPCIEEMPSLDEFTRRFGPQGVTVLTISIDKKIDRARAMLQQARPAFLTAWDPDADISVRYGTFMVPESYIIDRDGKVVYKIAQAQNWMDPEFLAKFQRLL